MKTLVLVIDGANVEDLPVIAGKPLDCEMDAMIHTASSCYTILTGEEAAREKVMQAQQNGFGDKKLLFDYFEGRKLIQDVPLLGGKIYKETEEIPPADIFIDMIDSQKKKLMHEWRELDFAMIWFYAIDKAFHAFVERPDEFARVVEHMNGAILKIISKVERDNLLILSDHGTQVKDGQPDHNRYGTIYLESSQNININHIRDIFPAILKLQGVK